MDAAPSEEPAVVADAAEPPAPDAELDAAVLDAEVAEPCVTRVCAEEVARRADSIVASHAAQPWPAKGTCWGDVTWAFASLVAGSDVDAANLALAALPTTYKVATELTVESDCYWAHTLIARLLLHPVTSARLDANARAALLDLMWTYVQNRSLVSDAAGTVWAISGSENHDAMRKSAYLLFTQVLALAGRGDDLLADGHSVSEHHAQWSEWWKGFLRARAHEGVSCEIASPTYALYGLQCVANLRDFADDDVLRRLANDFESLFWADYAQDFLAPTAVRGGGMSRMYKDVSMTQGNRENLYATTWMYGWHERAPGATNPAALIMATSDYRPPQIVTRMATEPVSQAYVSRHFGLGTQVQDPQGIAYMLSFPNGNASIRRESWRTPYYVLGGFTIDLSASYTALNGQNRAMGVMFANDVNDRIIVAGNGTDDGGRRGMAEIYGVSRKDCLIVARDSHASQSSGTRIFVSKGALWDNRMQSGDWVFTRAGGGYAAIRVASGGWTETAVTDGTMLDLGDMWAPVVIQTGTSDDYASLAAFQQAVSDNAFTYSAGKLGYTSEAGNAFELSSHSATQPKVDGQNVELNPALTYDSPYIQGVHGQDTVTLAFPAMTSVTLDFEY